ncbi:MAG: type II toxin-antitoxin system prevent-host-death family antitoxin [Verrucomicrobiales bacterium]|nr:type II toxin-antitoxin system prevent-host-death family antitoxin [Verrucomicrobiales bacterium]
MQVTIHEAKTQLSKLIAAVEAGEEVIIARRDKPVVRLEKVVEKKVNRMAGAGCLKGMMSQEAIDFLTTNKEIEKEIEKEFYGEDYEAMVAATEGVNADG